MALALSRCLPSARLPAAYAAVAECYLSMAVVRRDRLREGGARPGASVELRVDQRTGKLLMSSEGKGLASDVVARRVAEGDARP
ncbi:MAG: hypothetical protein RLZZ387_2142 [Chloroflexota bacterium]|jgi:hypothetical protein